MYCHPWRLVSPQKSLNSFLFVILCNICAKYSIGKFVFYPMPSSISDPVLDWRKYKYISMQWSLRTVVSGSWAVFLGFTKILNPVSCFKNIKVVYPWDYYPFDRFNRQSVRVIELNMSVKLNGLEWKKPSHITFFWIHKLYIWLLIFLFPPFWYQKEALLIWWQGPFPRAMFVINATSPKLVHVDALDLSL